LNYYTRELSKKLAPMVDVFTKQKRSEIMSKIRSKSLLETRFCKLLSASTHPIGLRYRKNYKTVPGSPDVAFVNKKVAVFIDGTFWHGYKYNSSKKKLPKIYWRKKIEMNILHDRKKRNQLRKMGWKVIRIWEHDFKNNPQLCIDKILKILRRGLP
jgi:DNA mismatch endonuclease (patch repair protein)